MCYVIASLIALFSGETAAVPIVVRGWLGYNAVTWFVVGKIWSRCAVMFLKDS